MRDFFLFPHTKGQMKGKCFVDVSEVKKKNPGGLEQYQHLRESEMFSAVGKTLVQLYQVETLVQLYRVETLVQVYRVGTAVLS